MSDALYQTLTYGSPVGPRGIEAPAGWEFNPSAITAWVWLVSTTRKLRGELKTRRERDRLEGEHRAYSLVLANSLGMTITYWGDAAHTLVKLEDET